MKNSFSVILPSVLQLLLTFLSTSDVQGQVFGNCELSTAIIDPTQLPLYGVQTVYGLLCVADTASGNNPSTSFTSFCAILDSAPFAAVKALLIDPTSRVTVFAPVNAAFTAVSAEYAGFDAAKQLRTIELHILTEAKLVGDLTCGGSVCTLNTSGVGGSSCVQRTKTRCPSGGNVFQIGPGNSGPQTNWPEIGVPVDTFTDNFDTGDLYPWQAGNEIFIFSNGNGDFAQDAIACNGIIQALDKVILPGPGVNGGKGGKGGYYGVAKDGKSVKDGKGGVYYGFKGGKRRELDQEIYEDEDEENNSVRQHDERNTSHERRKRLLESLINPNGDVEQLNE